MAIITISKLDLVMMAAGHVVKKALLASFGSSAAEIAAAMKQACPKDTGALADTIVTTAAGEQTPSTVSGNSETVPDGVVRITAGGQVDGRSVDYAKHVEFGTEKMAAEPFFFPTVNAMRGKTIADASNAVSSALGSLND